MKFNRSLSSVLVIVGALAVPAVVLAQFTPRTQLTAASLNNVAANMVQVGDTVIAASLPSNTSTGAIAQTTYRAQADGVVTFGTAGDAVARTTITAGLEIAGAIRTIWRTNAGSGATFTVRDGQRFNVGGQATGAAGQSLAATISVYWTPLTADTDLPVVSN